MTMLRQFATAVPVALVLAGCASRPPAERGEVYVPPPVREASPVVQPPPAPSPQAQPQAPALPPLASREPAAEAPAASPALPPAARSLAAQAERASQVGDHEAAAAHLERALRIAPSHSVLWQNLAVVRYRQGDYDKVEGLALKSNALASGDNALRRENWRLIAEVRRLRGDHRGAEAAREQTRRLSSPSGGG
jgi:tetratricopeptide (TPR) repeat protein